MKMLDYRNAPNGMLVRRSVHYLKDRCGAVKQAFGILTEKRFYEDVDGGAQCWPVIHWEGDAVANINHPANVTPYRRHNLPEIELKELKPTKRP